MLFSIANYIDNCLMIYCLFNMLIAMLFVILHFKTEPVKLIPIALTLVYKCLGNPF